MYAEEDVVVEEILEEDHSIQKLKTNGGIGQAILYKLTCSRVSVGDRIRVNVTAGRLGLGTGGWDIVVAACAKQTGNKTNGHIMKARYTSSQHSVMSVDDPEHPDYTLFEQPFSLKDRNVLLAELHSMLPIILGAVRMRDKNKKIGVILSDQASLPAGWSDHMRIWKTDPNVFVVTTGQAFGGNEEAVTIPNALQWLTMKKEVDVLVISMGPGTVGTSTPYGFSGIALAEWANIVGALEGKPCWVTRISFREGRTRHYGISHHTTTALCTFTYAPSLLILPHLDSEKEKYLRAQLKSVSMSKQHVIIYEHSKSLLEDWKKWAVTYPLSVTTMGRNTKTDESYVLGVLAAVKHVLSGNNT
ncbi:DUF3866 family protein [Alteribacillus iranensis]|uniref:DUF3866 domain-containing protein n=1 Tax=Alteribacillus iranensis TaxID=930128 RepID=A0A1I1ZNA7_9BACI|nr:DUF3866 family protein [Alteribacillus iranensis]SFE32053.1 Protein of unknown function [Alteribacillus iranensis]